MSFVTYMREHTTAWSAASNRMLKAGMVLGKPTYPGGGGRFAFRVLNNQINKGMTYAEAKAEAVAHGNQKYGADQMQAWHGSKA